jgi:hypothetical protein
MELFNRFRDIPETPEYPDELRDDPYAEHLMGCIYGCIVGLMMLAFIFISIYVFKLFI